MTDESKNEETYEQEVSETVLVVVNSVPLRLLVAEALQRRGFEVNEAVNGVDALRQITQNGAPSSLVVSSSFGRDSGFGMVRWLDGMEKTRYLATVMVMDTPADMEKLRKKPFPTVVPVVKYESVDGLTDAIVDAHGTAVETSIEIRESQLPGEPTNTVPPPKTQLTEDMRKLDESLGHFSSVMDSVKEKKLPGPMMPELLQQVITLFKDENVSFGRIAQFVQKHQVLSGRLLQMANSAYYSRGAKITTIVQAISRLGLRSTSEVLQAVAARNFVVGSDKELQEIIRASLREAYFVALAAELLAKGNKSVDSSEVYTTGLLHNVGAIFFYYTLALMKQEKQIDKIDYVAIKTAAANRANALNKVVCEAMNLPDSVGLIYSEPGKAKTIVRLIQQAMWICDRIVKMELEEVTLDAEAELLGIDAKMAEMINGKLPELKNLLNDYGK